MTRADGGVAALLALSDERDRWLARLLDAERAAYQRGFSDGRASVALAEIEERYTQAAWWREYSATLRRIIQAETDPSPRMQRVVREVAEDQRFLRDARARLAAEPWKLTPLESCALRRIRLADPGDAA